MWRSAVLGFGLTIVVGGCGGGDDNAKPTARTTTSVVATTNTDQTPTGDTADQQLAERLLLTAADLPAGWTGGPQDPGDANTDEMGDELARCAGAPDPGESESASAEGLEFAMGESLSVSSSTTVVKTVGYAAADLLAVQSAAFPECLRSTLAQVLRDGLGTGPVGDPAVQVTPFAVARHGDASLGFRTSFSFEVQPGLTGQFVTDTVLMLKGRAEVEVDFTGLGQPFDPVLERSLIEVLGAKLDAAA